MAFLTDEESASLSITKAIFHVVGRAPTDFVQLDVAFDPAPFAEFFIDRIHASAKGVTCDFQGDSAVLASLKRIEADEDVFVAETQQLARAFADLHQGNAKKGAFLLFTLACDSGVIHAMLKLDHESVLTYRLLKNEGLTAAEISEFFETFVRTPHALQKGAIVRIRGDVVDLVVHDHANERGISQYFEEFLGARRRYTDADLTNKVVAIAKRVANAHVSDLAPDVRQNVMSRIYNAARSEEPFDPDDGKFKTAAFGMMPATSPISVSFARELRSAGLENERFVLDPTLIPPPSRRKVVTDEGFEVSYPLAFEDNIEIDENRADGMTTITITTRKIISNDVSTDQSRRRS